MRKLRHDTVIGGLAEDFTRNFSGIPKNSLLTFSWHLGCCVPHQILEYLASEQRSIRTLSLITDGTCPNMDDYSKVCKLKKLRSITWKGINVEGGLGTFHKLFKTNAQYLESIDLEPVTFTINMLRIESILGNAQTFPTLDFGSLQHLCLSHFTLGPDYELLASALRIEQLHSLKLRSCGKQLNFLEALTRSERGVNLWSFEIVHTEIVPHWEHTLVPIKTFLTSFTGLEELCIALREEDTTGESFLDAITHHKKTLKRLAYHMKARDDNRRSDLYDYFRDFSVPWEHELGSFLGSMKLDCLGFSLYPLTLKQKLEPYPRTDFTFKLVHFRIHGVIYPRRNLKNELLDAGRTFPFYTHRLKESLDGKRLIRMSELAQFAEWAFGPEGLPNLKVIAFGDFMMGSRYSWSQLLLCRRDPEDVEEDFNASTGRNESGQAKESKRKVDENNSEDEGSSGDDEGSEDEKRRMTKKRKSDEELSEDNKRQKIKVEEESSEDDSSSDDSSPEDSSSEEDSSSDDTHLSRIRTALEIGSSSDADTVNRIRAMMAMVSNLASSSEDDSGPGDDLGPQPVAEEPSEEEEDVFDDYGNVLRLRTNLDTPSPPRSYISAEAETILKQPIQPPRYFRILTPSDRDWGRVLNQVEGSREFLRACVLEQLIEGAQVEDIMEMEEWELNNP